MMLMGGSSVFLNKIVNFLGVGFALYGVASLYEMLAPGDPIVKHMVKCKYCRKRISVKVRLLSLSFTFPSLSPLERSEAQKCRESEEQRKKKGKEGKGEQRADGQQAKRCVNCTSWQDGREDKIAEAGDLLR